MIKTYNVGEAKTQLSSLLDEVQRGVEVIVAKNGKPVARVTKIEGIGKRPMGFVKGRLTRAFFEPLPDEELAEYACSENNIDREHLQFGPGPIRPDGTRGYLNPAPLPPPLPKK